MRLQRSPAHPLVHLLLVYLMPSTTSNTTARASLSASSSRTDESMAAAHARAWATPVCVLRCTCVEKVRCVRCVRRAVWCKVPEGSRVTELHAGVGAIGLSLAARRRLRSLRLVEVSGGAVGRQARPCCVWCGVVWCGRGRGTGGRAGRWVGCESTMWSCCGLPAAAAWHLGTGPREVSWWQGQCVAPRRARYVKGRRAGTCQQWPGRAGHEPGEVGARQPESPGTGTGRQPAAMLLPGRAISQSVRKHVAVRQHVPQAASAAPECIHSLRQRSAASCVLPLRPRPPPPTHRRSTLRRRRPSVPPWSA